jgi:hypothetical protein
MADARRAKALFAMDDTPETEGEEGETPAVVDEEQGDLFDMGQQSLFGELDELALESEPYRVTFKYEGGISDFVKNGQCANELCYKGGDIKDCKTGKCF